MEKKEIEIAEKTPDILRLEAEIKKKKEVVNISFDDELSPTAKKVVDLIRKTRKPKKEEVKPIAEPVEEKSSKEIKDEIFKELRLEEKRYTQEIEEEPITLNGEAITPLKEDFAPLPKSISPEKIDCEPQERQILQEKEQILIETPKIPLEMKGLEKQDLESDVILLQPYENFTKICPLCKKKVKRKAVKKNGMVLTQMFKCKNKFCGFQKEITITI